MLKVGHSQPERCSETVANESDLMKIAYRLRLIATEGLFSPQIVLIPHM